MIHQQRLGDVGEVEVLAGDVCSTCNSNNPQRMPCFLCRLSITARIVLGRVSLVRSGLLVGVVLCVGRVELLLMRILWCGFAQSIPAEQADRARARQSSHAVVWAGEASLSNTVTKSEQARWDLDTVCHCVP